MIITDFISSEISFWEFVPIDLASWKQSTDYRKRLRSQQLNHFLNSHHYFNSSNCSFIWNVSLGINHTPTPLRYLLRTFSKGHTYGPCHYIFTFLWEKLTFLREICTDIKGENTEQTKKSWSKQAWDLTKKSEPQMLWKECLTLREQHVQKPSMKQNKIHSGNQKILDECGM